MKKQIKIYNLETGEVRNKTLPEIFESKHNPLLLTQAVRVYLANQRKAHAKAKTRGEVSGSGKKIWKQKHTGRARHGDRYSNIFVGGGAAFGPTGMENWHRELPKGMGKKALGVALSQKFSEEKVILVENWQKVGGKTKEAVLKIGKVLAKAGFTDEKNEKRKKKTLPGCTLVFTRESAQFGKSLKNLSNFSLVTEENLNVYQILSKPLIILEEAALPGLAKRLNFKND